MWWRKKSIPKIKVINFVIRNNKTYKILFNGFELVLDKKRIWIRDDEKISFNVYCILKFLGTGPQNFRKKVKRKTRTSKELD